ncbi:hypothetical protein IFM89_038709 [Coptis chinensis]|uniref:Uncharacterized protein n=1 Tax=Coptis chinensis TaxID=261450 RepID=A0A835H312_9MAGN|nr:hypothetical protein IFM89_038709 [Coptis chinensis]
MSSRNAYLEIGVGSHILYTYSLLHFGIKYGIIFQKFWGRELLAAGAIGVKDLEVWQYSKSNIVNIGIPAYTFLRCFFECESTRFLMRKYSILLTIHIIFASKFSVVLILSCESTALIGTINVFSPFLPIRRVTRYWAVCILNLSCIFHFKLQGFCSMLSRLPSFRSWFHEVVKALVQEEKRGWMLEPLIV